MPELQARRSFCHKRWRLLSVPNLQAHNNQRDGTMKAIRFLAARIRAWWREHICDEGWEDETGFHRGRMYEGEK
jgi:hypothetical protein